MVGMEMRVDDVAHGRAKPIFHETLDRQCLFRKQQRVDQHHAICRHDDTSRHLRIKVARENKNVVCNSFSLHYLNYYLIRVNVSSQYRKLSVKNQGDAADNRQLKA
jgi:hypothetical protein